MISSRRPLISVVLSTTGVPTAGLFGLVSPTCSKVSSDEATLVALCGLAQGDYDGPLLASLDVMMAPTASRVAAVRLKAFAVALATAGLRFTPSSGMTGGRLN